MERIANSIRLVATLATFELFTLWFFLVVC